MSKIRKLLLQKQSKNIRNKVIDIVLQEPQLMEELMDCYFDQDSRMNQYASWPIGVIGEKHPDLVYPYLDLMVKSLDKPLHNGSIRNVLRVLQFITIPEELEGIVYDKCFLYLDDPKVPIAIRAFSMTVLSNIAMKYPDLKEELIKTIELYYPTGSPGYQSRAKRELKRMKLK